MGTITTETNFIKHIDLTKYNKQHEIQLKIWHDIDHSHTSVFHPLMSDQSPTCEGANLRRAQKLIFSILAANRVFLYSIYIYRNF